eukprot:TRINITY_DN21845_c0_g4_i1.p1 TRINITY_DN21845_c0_g4~~TRINITY_DN21845_c0_g4_i1.p1  ORF type:complete len:281 (+),score=67.15 TRINITY_DN21845_c0_g4_i1:66-845(+)
MASSGADDAPRLRRRTGRAAGETLIVGLTGGIGMGKSTVSKWFQSLGVPVDDADATVHRLYAPGGAAVEPIRAAFGDGVIENDGVNRAKLSSHVVGAANAENMKRLEAIVHPLVSAARTSFVERVTREKEALAVLDIPLLFESGLERLCDLVVVVSAPAALQRERVLARANMPVEKFEAILAKQLPDALKRKSADVIIDTGASLESTEAEVAAFVERTRRAVAAEPLQQQRRRQLLVAGGLLTAALVLVGVSRARRRSA